MTLHLGRLAADIKITEIRPLTRADLQVIREGRKASVVTRLRDPHHHLARLLAAGVRPAEAAARSGYSMARVYTMNTDPAFIDLVATYRKQVDSAFIESQDDYYTLATGNMLKAERMLAEKLDAADEEGELLPTRDLIAISRDAADRFGYGKRTTNLNVNVDFAAKLEAALAAKDKVIEGRSSLIDVTPADAPSRLRRA